MHRSISSLRVNTRLCWATFIGIGITRAMSAQTPAPAPAQAPVTVAATLAQAGYVAIPFSWETSGDGHQLVNAKIDTTDISLNLDSGFNGMLLLSPEFSNISGVRPLKVANITATLYGSERNFMALVDRIAFGPLQLTDLESSVTTPLVAQGYIGMGVLQSRQAIIDFVHDTLYLRSAPKEQPSVNPHAAESTLYGVLKAAGQYNTFLSLMQDANLTPLLEGTTSGTTLDSISWRYRNRAIQQFVTDTTLDERARTLATRQALNTQFRKQGQLTAFVPTDAAFAQLGAETLHKLRTDRSQLIQMLRGHLLVDSRLTPPAVHTFIARAAQPDGGALGFFPMGPALQVERLTSPEEGKLLARATVVGVDSATNGIVYGIDRVLLGPPEPVLPTTLLTQQGYVAIPLYRHEGGTYHLHVKLNGTPLSLALDTGAPEEVIVDEELAERTPNLLSESATLEFESATTVTANSIAMSFKEPNKKMRAADVSPVSGLIGAKILQRYHAYVDFATSTLYLAFPPSQTP